MNIIDKIFGRDEDPGLLPSTFTFGEGTVGRNPQFTEEDLEKLLQLLNTFSLQKEDFTAKDVDHLSIKLDEYVQKVNEFTYWLKNIAIEHAALAGSVDALIKALSQTEKKQTFFPLASDNQKTPLDLNALKATFKKELIHEDYMHFLRQLMLIIISASLVQRDGGENGKATSSRLFTASSYNVKK